VPPTAFSIRRRDENVDGSTMFCPLICVVPEMLSELVEVRRVMPSMIVRALAAPLTLRITVAFAASRSVPIRTESPATGAPLGDQLAPAPQLPLPVFQVLMAARAISWHD